MSPRRFLLLFLAASLVAQAQSKDWISQFKDAEAKFDSRQQSECIPLFEKLLQSMETESRQRILTRKERSIIERSYDFLGQAEYNRNEQQKARAAFLKLIEWNPDYRMNEDLVSQKILDSFHSLKRENLAMLTVRTTPSGAAIRLDGRELGITNFENGSILKGKHQLEIQLPGYRSEMKEFEIQAGSMQEISVVLAEDPVSAGIARLDAEIQTAHASGDTIVEAKTRQKLGRFQMEENKYDEAATTLEQALKLVHSRGNEDISASLLLDLGTLYEQQGAMPRARESLEEAAGLLRKVQNSALLAEVLQSLGRLAYLANDLTSAKAYDEEAIVLFKEVGKTEKAEESELRLRSISTRSRSRSGELLREAYALMGAGNYGDAEKKYIEALNLSRESGDKANQANALLNLGFLFSSSGRESDAVPYWEEALSLSRDSGDGSREALALYNLAIAAYNRGEQQKADELYEQSAMISRKLGEKPRKKLW